MDRILAFKVFLLLMCIPALSLTQSESENIEIAATIFGEDINSQLPFATVFNKQSSNGTASNLEGYFVLPNNQQGDTIVISYLGYENKEIVITGNFPKTIRLTPITSMLDQVVVVADDDYLYDFVSKLRKKKRTKTRNSKTYFFLETKINDASVEIIESYYNGKYSNLGIRELNIKKGRIGLKPLNHRYYRSTESSKLFSIHDVFAKSKLFPANPLSIKKKELKKRYELDLSHSFIKEGSKILVVEFYPKKDRRDLFSGTIWLDQTNNKLIKISLRIKDSELHPFVPIGFNTIQGIDMEITKSYENIGGQQFINTIDFAYNVSYTDKSGNDIVATTKAFTKAYDYSAEFHLPKFDFTTHYHEDYRNITAIQYDSVFWNRTTEFRFYDRLEEIQNFMVENKIDNRILYPVNKQDSLNSQLQFPYILWDENRFKMSQANEETISLSKRSTPFEINRFNFNVKLYLDINKVQDSLIYQLCSILDPVDSYYYFYMSPIDLMFMNIYFDLMEVQKRKFEAELKRLKNPDRTLIEELYDEHMIQFEKTISLYISKTNRGKNTKEIEKWNQYIIEHLNINNIDYFAIEKEK